MKRKITLLVCVVTVLTMIFGACGTQQQQQVKVGEIDGKPVYKDELESWLVMMDTGKEVLEDEQYADYLPEILDYFMSMKVMDVETASRGYLDKLTADQISEAEEYAQQYIDYTIQNSGQTEEEVLKDLGFTKEELIEQYKVTTARDALFTDLVGGTVPTEEQIKQQYDTMVASQKESMDAAPSEYVANVLAGADIYYAPAGVRMVRKLLIPVDETWAEAIALLRGSDYNEQADVLLTTALAKIQADADTVKEKLSTGTSFSDAMTQYNKDAEAPAGGYAVTADVIDYDAKFTEKAMALTSVGQISEMFATDEGYQIIEYTSNVTPGAVAYESIKDKTSESMLLDVQQDAWTVLIEQWKKDHNVKTFVENLKTTKASASPAAASATPAE